MQLLNATTILTAISKARKAYKKGTLSHEVAKITVRDFWLATDKQVDINKKQLIQMAKNGENRPNFRKHDLGSSLYRYTKQSSNCYDPIFTKKIKAFAPHWFIHTSTIKKQQLLKLAKSNQPRPNRRKHPLGQAFSSYTRTSHKSYDPIFTKQIKSLAPYWFIHTANTKKQQLIQMAKNKESRPSNRIDGLGKALNRYTTKSGTSYDPDFTKKIKSLAPAWFRK
jgi:hypothetical protein